MKDTTWQHESIIVRPDTGPLVAVEAEVLGYLALVPTWSNGEYDGDGNQTVVFDRQLLPPVWAIVHLPTQQVMAFSLTHDDARRFCRRPWPWATSGTFVTTGSVTLINSTGKPPSGGTRSSTTAPKSGG